MAGGAHPHGQPTEPLQQIQLMRALIEQHTAALAIPRCAPRPGIVVALRAIPVRHNPDHALDFAQCAAVNQRLRLAVDAVRALVEHHAEGQFGMLIRLRDHVPHLQGVHARRLFAQDMLSMAERLNRQRRMLIMRRCNQHRVTGIGRNQVAALAENRSVRHGCANPLSAAFLAVCHSGQLHFRAFAAQDVVGVQAGNAARTDDSKSKHTETLPS